MSVQLALFQGQTVAMAQRGIPPTHVLDTLEKRLLTGVQQEEELLM